MLIAAVILALTLCLILVRVLPLLACALSVLLTAGCLFAAPRHCRNRAAIHARQTVPADSR